MTDEFHIRITAEEAQRWYSRVEEVMIDYCAAVEHQITMAYFVFQDHGLVDPYYDDDTFCGSTDDEWDVFV